MKPLVLYKNKTEKYFIFIDKIGNNEILVIIPTGRLILIEIERFIERIEMPINEAIENAYITEAQRAKYSQYKVNRSEEEKEKRICFFIEMPSLEQKKLLDELLEIYRKGKN